MSDAPARILVVEDEGIVSIGLMDMLESFGYEIAGSAMSGEDALRLCDDLVPDLVLMDIELKGEMDGIEAADRIKQKLGVPVIFITAYDNDAYIKRAKITEPYGYVPKPINKRELHFAIEIALHKHRADMDVKLSRDGYQEVASRRAEVLAATNVELEREIIERKRAEAALRESNILLAESSNYLDSILFSFPDVAIVATDLQFRVKYCNPAAEHLLGCTARDVLGRAVPEIHVSYNVSEGALDRAVSEVKGGGQFYHLAERVLADGSMQYIEIRVSGIRSGDSTVVGFVMAARDVTERVYSERAIHESFEQYRRLFLQFNALLDAITDEILLLTPDLTVVWANRSLFMDETSINEEYGPRCYELRMGARGQCEGCPVRSTISRGVEGSAELLASDGRIIEVRTFPVFDDNGELVNIIELASDVTEKTRIRSESYRTAQMASLGEMAAGVAHEINNPINGIINYARIALMNEALPERERDISQRIIKEGERIAAIVKSLLSFSRDSESEKSLHDIREVLDETLLLVESLARNEGTEVELDVPEALPRVKISSGQMRQVFLNLVNNARYALNLKYPTTTKDKKLFIGASIVSQEGREFLKITFRDQGVGMSDEVRSKSLNMFYTTKKAGEGTGLGLSICNSIVADHGGTLTLESHEGSWTEISVCLPV